MLFSGSRGTFGLGDYGTMGPGDYWIEAEAFRKRRYPKSFISKLSDSEGEAAETQVWLNFAQAFGYMDQNTIQELDEKYEIIQKQIISMSQSPEKWST